MRCASPRAAKPRGHADIEYRAIRIAGNKIERAVVNLLRFMDPPSALVFCNTRNAVRHMEAHADANAALPPSRCRANCRQSERNHALQALRDGRARVCVATDVAARGIDLPNLGLVIHADLPNDAEVLQHRSGRTGRAGQARASASCWCRRRAAAAPRRCWAAPASPRSGAMPPSADDIRKLDQERLLQNPLLVEAGSDDDLAMADDAADGAQPAPDGGGLCEDVPRRLARAGRDRGRTFPARQPAARDTSRATKARVNSATQAARQTRARPRETGRAAQTANASMRRPMNAAPRRASMANGVWFRLNVGRERNADPKWLLPEICRQGEVTKKDIGAIRVFEMETLFQIDAGSGAEIHHPGQRTQEGRGAHFARSGPDRRIHGASARRQTSRRQPVMRRAIAAAQRRSPRA